MDTPIPNPSEILPLGVAAHGHEALDDPDTPPALVQRMLREIAVSNRWFGGARAMRAGLTSLVDATDRGATLTLLDIGTGAGDLPMNAVRWGRQRGIRIQPIGLERHPAATTLAQGNGLPMVLGCAGALPIRRRGVDIILLSQVVHHLDEASIVRLLTECDAIARRGVVIADLRPSRLAAFGYRMAGPMIGMHPTTVTDGVTSLTRGFTAQQLQALVRRAIGRDVRAWQMLGARVIAAWRTTP